MIVKMRKMLFDFTKSEEGFTTFEIMIVIALLTILISIIVINVMPASDQTRVLQVKSEAQDAYDIVEIYRLSTTEVDIVDLEDNIKAVLQNRYSKNTLDAKYYKIDSRTGVNNKEIYKVSLHAKLDDGLIVVSEFEVIEKSELKVICRGDSGRVSDLTSSGVCSIS